MDVQARRNPRSRRRILWFLMVFAVAGLLVAAAGCGGGDGGQEAAPPATEAPPTEAPPAEEPPAEEPPAEEPAECSVEGVDDGEINVFAAADTPSAVIGENISPAGHGRMSQLWLNRTNEAGGLLGCPVTFTVEDDTFDIPTCVRQYRDALASGKYDFFVGPTNSGCMAALPELTSAAGEWLFSGIAADHQPFFENFTPFVAHASVSTFLEGRTAAVFAQQQGWKRVAIMVPNYAYGQDVGKGFKGYYSQIVPDGQVVDEQFPEFDEDNFTPFINAMVGKDPDGILTAFFSSFILPFVPQWKDSGNDANISVISGLAVFDTMAGFKSAGDVAQNFYGYDRGNYALLQQNPVGKEYLDLWVEAYGDEFPLPDSFAYQLLGTWQMAKALVEQTQSVDPAKWKALIETGTFAFDGPYSAGPTYVNPINHMADSCASVGKIVFDEARGVGSYDPASFVVACMHDVLGVEEAVQLTDNPDVTQEAIDAYYAATSGG